MQTTPMDHTQDSEGSVDDGLRSRVDALTEREQFLTARQIAQVDKRQDELMGLESVDGRPPTHRQNAQGWPWVVAILIVIAACAIAFATTKGIGAAAVVGGGIMIVVLLLSGWPVWTSVVLRRREYQVARKEALAELQDEVKVVETTPVVVAPPNER